MSVHIFFNHFQSTLNELQSTLSKALILNLFFLYIRTLDFKIRSDLCECASGGMGLAPKPADRQTGKQRKIGGGGGGGVEGGSM